MSNRTLEIDGMSGDACVKKVTGALKDVRGVSNPSVTVGEATMKADQAGCDAACSAIGKAGYKAREDTQATGGNRTGESKRDGDRTTESNKPAQAVRADAGNRPGADSWTNEGGGGVEKKDAKPDLSRGSNDQKSNDQSRMPNPSPAVANAGATTPSKEADGNKAQIGSTPTKPVVTKY